LKPVPVIFLASDFDNLATSEGREAVDRHLVAAHASISIATFFWQKSRYARTTADGWRCKG